MTFKKSFSILLTVAAIANAANAAETLQDAKQRANDSAANIAALYRNGAPAFLASETRVIMESDYTAGSYTNPKHGGLVAMIQRAQSDVEFYLTAYNTAVNDYRADNSDDNAAALGIAEERLAYAVSNLDYYVAKRQRVFCRWFDACFAADTFPKFDVSDEDNAEIEKRFNDYRIAALVGYHSVINNDDEINAKRLKIAYEARAELLFEIVVKMYGAPLLPAQPSKSWGDYSKEIDDATEQHETDEQRVEFLRKQERQARK